MKHCNLDLDFALKRIMSKNRGCRAIMYNNNIITSLISRCLLLLHMTNRKGERIVRKREQIYKVVMKSINDSKLET